MGELALRMVCSLAVVVGLLMLAARLAGRRFKGRSDSEIQVLQRQAIARGSQISVVQVRDRVLVLGSTEQQVRLLADLTDPTVEQSLLSPEQSLLSPEQSVVSPEQSETDTRAVTSFPSSGQTFPAEQPEPAEEPMADVVPLTVVPPLAAEPAPVAEVATSLPERREAQPTHRARLDLGPIASTDPFAPRIRPAGKHRAPVDEPSLDLPVEPALAPVLSAPIEAAPAPAEALLESLDERAALLDLLFAARQQVEQSGELQLSQSARPTTAVPAARANAATTPVPSERDIARAKRRLAKQEAKEQAKQAALQAKPDQSALAGSVLSPQTWRQAFQAVSGRAS